MGRHIPDAVKESVLKRQRFRCADCGVCVMDDVFDMDHVVPYCITKSHAPEALQALCPTCHARKSRKELRDILLFQRLAGASGRSARLCWTCRRVVSAYWYRGYMCTGCHLHGQENSQQNVTRCSITS